MVNSKVSQYYTLEKCLENKVSAEWFIILKNFTTLKKYKKGERLVQEGSKVDGYFFINSGKVKIVTTFDGDHERILRLSHRGNIVGHRAINSDSFPISAIALTEVEATFIPKDTFQKMIRSNPDFAMYLVEFIATDLRETEERMKSMIHNDVIVRIALILCMLIDSYGYDAEEKNKLHFTLPRSDMASMAGTSYESVIRTLSKLEDMKLIRLENKSIIILKEAALRKLSQERSRL